VLVALAVLAIAMAALIKSAGGFTSNQAYLENKTIAHWVALDQMAKLRVASIRPSVGAQEEQREMAGRVWNWRAEIYSTPNPMIMKAEVTVKRENEENIYAMLTGYIEVPQ
jgi:general secretion pathway protein I